MPIIKLKSNNIISKNENQINKCLIIDSIVIVILMLILWSVIGSWLYSKINLYIELYLSVLSITLIGSYYKNRFISYIMFIMVLAPCLYMIFNAISLILDNSTTSIFMLILSLSIIYLNLKAVIEINRFKETYDKKEELL